MTYSSVRISNGKNSSIKCSQNEMKILKYFKNSSKICASFDAEMAQMVCGSCRHLLSYPRGARYVECACCLEENYVLEGPLSSFYI